MNIKKTISKFAVWVVIIAMLAVMIPAVSGRFCAEANNKNVTVSLLYNNIRNTVSPVMLEEMLGEYYDAGVTTSSVMEEDINSLVARGEVTSIKLNVLLHKYDQESMDIASVISENYPEVSYDSHLVMVKKPWAKEFIREHISSRYGKDEYVGIKGVDGMDIYAFYDGREKLWNLSLGYDEDIIEMLSEKGFEICLVHTVRGYADTEYLDYIDGLVKRYNIGFFNIKEASGEYDEDAADNYKGIADIIKDNGLTLVVTENTDQLSNQKTFGYSHIFDSVMNDGTGKVLRSYETYDDSQDDGSHYIYRTNQFFNSTIDRNIRFITVTQIASANVPYDECAEFTLKAVSEYINRIKAEGFSVNEDITPYNYPAPGKIPFAACVVIMIMLAVSAISLIRGKDDIRITVAGIVVSVVAFVGTFVIPASLLSLYPSVYCVAISCYAMTVLLRFVKSIKTGVVLSVFSAVVVVLATLCVGMLGMGAMLSGIDYYVNNLIFRGIKLSLLVPVFYTLVIYYLIYVKNEKGGFLSDVKRVMTAEIKVYWLIISAVVLGVGAYYIMRSGNVNKISSVELAMRNLITEIFPARPRTKEFLIGYPALVLFVYHVKKTDWKLIQWGCAVMASILAASVTNSFCHVFTDLSTIYMRVFNGLIIGIAVSVVVYMVNLLLVRCVKWLQTKLT